MGAKRYRLAVLAQIGQKILAAPRAFEAVCLRGFWFGFGFGLLTAHFVHGNAVTQDDQTADVLRGIVINRADLKAVIAEILAVLLLDVRVLDPDKRGRVQFAPDSMLETGAFESVRCPALFGFGVALNACVPFPDPFAKFIVCTISVPAQPRDH